MILYVYQITALDGLEYTHVDALGMLKRIKYTTISSLILYLFPDFICTENSSNVKLSHSSGSVIISPEHLQSHRPAGRVGCPGRPPGVERSPVRTV